MKRYILVILFFASFLVGAKAQKKAKVVFIIVDGISADIMEENDLPNLKEISRAGGYISAYQGGEKGLYNESPTISAVGYNNVLTGVWYNKHNVEDNYIKNPNYNYPTLFKLVKNSNPDKKLAIFSELD